jgi:thiol-disulfide isomerase/thioredoxin
MAASMVKKALLALGALAAVLTGTVAGLYITNEPPAVPVLSTADATKPYVVKLHAQWCPYCMLTKDEWAQLQDAYEDRVNLAVLDFTNDATTERSRVEANRLGLGDVFEWYFGATGLVVVLDGRTRDVLSEVGGNASFDEYRAAVDAALAVH